MAITRVFSSITSAANNLKPHKSEATQRIRTNSLCLGTTMILSYLLPLPSLPTAMKAVISSSSHQKWSYEWVWEWICVLETAFVALLVYNIIEASYAIKYPRVPPPVPPTDRTKATVASTPQKRAFKVLSPKTSPQVQKPFAFLSKSISSRPLSHTLSKSQSTYVQSPLETPSRIINYGPVPPSSSTNTQASSTLDYLQTPSPVISAYRAKHTGIDVGHALDGSYLSRILPDDEVDEE